MKEEKKWNFPEKKFCEDSFATAKRKSEIWQMECGIIMLQNFLVFAMLWPIETLCNVCHTLMHNNSTAHAIRNH